MLEKNSIWSNLAYIIEALLMIVGVFLALSHQYIFKPTSSNFENFLQMVPWLIVIYIILNNFFDTHIYYNRTKIVIILYTFCVQLIFSFIVTVICHIYINTFNFSIFFLIFNTLVGTILSGTVNLIIFTYLSKVSKRKKVLVMGEAKAVFEALDNFNASKEPLHSISYIVIGNYMSHLKAVIDQVDVVYMAGILDHNESSQVYNYLIRKDKTIYYTANIENTVVINSRLLSITDESIIKLSPYSLTIAQATVKRAFDIIASLAFLLLFSPIMVLTAIALKIESNGPVFYRQERVTLGNKTFQILKFRSMVVDAEKDLGPVLASANDSRVTRVGKFIRATRIDEIPQLINVLKGEMSIVGPRPERPKFTEEFTNLNQFYPLRHNVRAGITGYAQVYGRYISNFESKLKFDLLYIKTYSFGLDIKLLLKTVLVVFDKFSSNGREEINDLAQNNNFYSEDVQILK
ncbi:sugar transferase [Streptococcus suis]|nr:sugar transferase [Streptococcus suis]